MPDITPPAGYQLDATPQPPAGYQLDNAPDFSVTKYAKADDSFWGPYLEKVNPVNFVRSIALATSQPLQAIQGMGAAHYAILREAEHAYQRGDYKNAVRHFINYLVPVFGPEADEAGNSMVEGKYRRGMGQTLGTMTNIALPELVGRLANVRIPGPVKDSTTATTRAALDMLEQQYGIPVSAAVRTGSEYLQKFQKKVDSTVLGHIPAERAQRLQSERLRAASDDLMNRAHPTAVTEQGVGEDVRSALEAADAQRQAAFGAEGDALAAQIHPQYVSPEQAGAGVQNAAQSAYDQSVAALHAQADQLLNRIHPQPTTAEQVGSGTRGQAERVVQSLQAEANQAYEPFHRAANSNRYAREVTVGHDAEGNPIREVVRMPIDMRGIKADLKPLYDSMSQWLQPSLRFSSQGYQAIKSILEGPDYLPASVAESGALSGLKTLGREGEYEAAGGSEFQAAMRDVNQGIGARATKLLQDQIDAAAARAGVYDSLRQGRQATAQKYEIADTVVKKLSKEPVGIYGQMTQPGDSNIAFQRRVADTTPTQLAPAGRVFAQDVFEKARAGDWNGAMRAWDALGDESRRLLYDDPQIGPQIRSILERGQQLKAGSLPAQLPNEPVGTFRALTQKGDSRIDLARQAQQQAPAEISKVARAHFESILDKARQGDWKGALSDWNALGPQSQAIYYSDPTLAAGIDSLLSRAAEHADTATVRQLAKEPVGIFRQMTQPEDARIQFLDRVKADAPDLLPQAGRAWLAGVWQKAREAGGFDVKNALSMANEYRSLGAGTKERLFPNPLHRERLNQFFLGLEKLAENPNPSGTELTRTVTQELGMHGAALGAAYHYGTPLPVIGSVLTSLGAYGFSRLLHSPAGVKLLTEGLTISPALAQSARATMWSNQVLKLAGDLQRKDERDKRPQLVN